MPVLYPTLKVQETQIGHTFEHAQLTNQSGHLQRIGYIPR
jgi:hypothetical protein